MRLHQRGIFPVIVLGDSVAAEGDVGVGRVKSPRRVRVAFINDAEGTASFGQLDFSNGASRWC